MSDDIYDQNTKEEVKESLIKIISSVENYSENSFKIILKIKKDDYKANKFMFFPKSKVTEHTDDFIILPKWIYEKSLNEMLEKESNFFKDKYKENVNIDEYEVLTETREM